MVHPPNLRPRALPMPGKPENQPSFSIDEFIGEIEKAEADRLNKRLPQERLKNKRALDNAARRAAEAAGNTGKLVPQPLKSAITAPLAGEVPELGPQARSEGRRGGAANSKRPVSDAEAA